MRSWKRAFFSTGRELTRQFDRGSDKFDFRVKIIQDKISRREGSYIEE